MNKSNVVLGSVILILICVAVSMGWMIYQNKISDMDGRIAGLNSQISSLQSQIFSLQSQNAVLVSQNNQLNMDLSQSKKLKTFSSFVKCRFRYSTMRGMVVPMRKHHGNNVINSTIADKLI